MEEETEQLLLGVAEQNRLPRDCLNAIQKLDLEPKTPSFDLIQQLQENLMKTQQNADVMRLKCKVDELSKEKSEMRGEISVLKDEDRKSKLTYRQLEIDKKTAEEGLMPERKAVLRARKEHKLEADKVLQQNLEMQVNVEELSKKLERLKEDKKKSLEDITAVIGEIRQLTNGTVQVITHCRFQ